MEKIDKWIKTRCDCPFPNFIKQHQENRVRKKKMSVSHVVRQEKQKENVHPYEIRYEKEKKNR